MDGQPRVSAPPHRQSAPSAARHADHARISLPGRPPRPHRSPDSPAIRGMPGERLFAGIFTTSRSSSPWGAALQARSSTSRLCMPMPLARAVVAMLILMILPATAGSPPSPSFTSWLETQMMESKIPGVSIAVIKDYRVEWAAGFGMSDTARQVKVTPHTLFQAASVSKAISAIALMIALEEHKLSVDDEVNATLAKFPPEESVGQWRLRNGFPTKVTLRMLLSHIGGTNDFRYSGYRYGYYNNPPGPIEPIPTMHQELTGLPPSNTPAITVVREPGSTWVYSPAGYTVIQAILMNIYGKPFSEIMADVVLKPLHLRQSTFDQPTPNALTPEIAVPYLTDGRRLPDGPRVFDTAASGGLTTTPTELAELVIAVQNREVRGQKLSVEIHRSARVAPLTLTTSAAFGLRRAKFQ